MAKRRGRKNPNQPVTNQKNDEVPMDHKEQVFEDHEVERQSAAIRALRDVEIDHLRNMLRLLRSYFSKEQLEFPVLQYFKENLPDLSIAEMGKDGQREVQWKEQGPDLFMNQTDERMLHTSLLRQLSTAYPDYSAGILPLGGFEFSNKSMKTSLLGADKCQIQSLVLEEPSDSQVLGLNDGLQTPDVNSNRMSVGMTPKTRRLPKCGEMLLSVHGSPLGVYKEDNMETIQETEDG